LKLLRGSGRPGISLLEEGNLGSLDFSGKRVTGTWDNGRVSKGLSSLATLKCAGKRITNITKRTLEVFQAYNWPGNVRELQNVVERAIVLCEGDTFSVDETWLKYELPQEQRSATRVERGLVRLDASRERELNWVGLFWGNSEPQGLRLRQQPLLRTRAENGQVV
jgi:transcriptional regulator with AAA-type ATPase domain